MVHATGTINKLESDLIPFANLAEKPVLRLTLAEPFLEEADVAMVSAVRASIAVAEPLRQQLDEVASVLKGSAAPPLDVVAGLDLRKLQSDLERYTEAEERLWKMPTRQSARLFAVDAQKAKATLHSTARRLKEELCSQAITWLEGEIKELHEKWTEALKKASIVPTSEQELISLKTYLAAVNEETAPLISRGSTVSSLLDLLEGYFAFAPPKVQKQAFELDCCVLNLKMSLCETNSILEMAKERLEAKRLVRTQQLQVEFDAMRVDVETAASSFKHIEDSSAYLPILDGLRKKVQAVRAEVENLRKAEGLFGLDASDFKQLESVCVPFYSLDELWTAAGSFVKTREKWLGEPLAQVDCDEVEHQLQNWLQAASAVRRKVGVFQSVEPLHACNELLHAIGSFQKLLPLMKTLTHPSFQAKHWQELLTQLEVTADPENEQNALSFNALLQNGLTKAAQAIEQVGSVAAREFRIKGCFQKMRGAWRALRMELVTLEPEASTRRILKGFDAIHSLIEEHQASVQSMQASQLVGGIELQAREWLRKLTELERLCSFLESFQISWIYLVPIFDYPEIQQQLAKETKALDVVSKFWTEEVIGRLDENASLLDLAELEELPQKLQSACNDMAMITRGLSNFLERKRLAFPRFFFLSNEELVQLLAGTSQAQGLISHIQKCFEGIQSLQFNQDETEATTMLSHKGEVLPLVRTVRLLKDGQTVSIEDLFSSIEREMCDALYIAMKQAWEEFPIASSRMLWSTETCACAQAALAIAHCCWTSQVEAAIMQHQLSQLVKDLQQQLQQLVEAVRGPLCHRSRSTLETLMTIDVHCRDVAEDLARLTTTHINHFEWICHLRSYWKPSSNSRSGRAGFAGFRTGGREPSKGGGVGNSGVLQIRMLDSSLNYGFELLRSPERLVVTPLTDRCYRTLMTALNYQYGGAPEGPAGTGKTETTKDLSKAAGKPCLVFNCSEGLDAVAMAALLKGLAASGGWCCFDEFNRMQLDVLSVVALQISAIQQAIRRRALTFVFEDTDLRLNPTCVINITMNPGYAGRAILPETLKALFRPCTMIVPDSAMIAEVVLYCSGFQAARELSKKMVACLKLASEQLSQQNHYDFGMRAAVAVLNTAKRLFLQRDEATEEGPSFYTDNFQEQEKVKRYEAITVCKALRLANIPKLHPTDKTAFEEILRDLFNEDDLVAAETHQPLRPFLIQAAQTLFLEPSEGFLTAALQVLATVDHRHGLILVGAAGTGKTAALNCLKMALELQKAASAAAALPTRATANEQAGGTLPEPAELENGSETLPKITPESINGDSGESRSLACSCVRIFPKALEVDELYGTFDSTTQEWRGGALEQAVRKASKERELATRHWIVLDGPVDVGWVENLNTVLDDNKKLCLSSGEVVRLSPLTALLFEVTDLRCASPATISRCGIVYIHENVLHWESLLHAWSLHSSTAKLLGETLAAEVTQKLRACCDLCVTFIAKSSGGPLRITANRIVCNVLRIFDAVITQTVEFTESGDKRRIDQLESSLEGALAFALLWGAGGTLSVAERPAFDLAFRSMHSGRFEILEQMGLLSPEPSSNGKNDQGSTQKKRSRLFAQHLPPTGSCFDVFWDLQEKKWLSWSSLTKLPDVRQGTLPAASLQQILIETPETALVEHFLCLTLAQDNAHLLLVGEAGSGKSKCTLQQLQRMALDVQKQYVQQQQAKESATALQQKATPAARLISKAGGLSIQGSSRKSPFAFLSLSLTGATSPSGVQQWLEARMERRRAEGLRPLGWPRGVLLLDDLHLPTIEESGAQPAGELFRQLLDCGGWHQRSTWGFCSVEGLTFSATCRATQQQQQLSERLTRHFVPILGIPYSAESLQSILHQILLLRFDKCSNEVVAGLQTVATLTTKVYSQVQQRLPPRPVRWTQQWTARDCWRVVQRMAALNVVGLESRQQLLCCWLHEVRRVFQDRIAAEPDLNIFNGVIEDVLKDTAHYSPADLEPPEKAPLLFAFRETAVGGGTKAGSTASTAEDVILGSRVYERVALLEAQSLCADGLEQYLLLHPKAPLSLVLFPQAIEHALRCMNTFLHPQGHAFLLGVGGSGRRSVARLAAFLAGFETVEPHGADYSIAISEWQEDLKSVILAAGTSKKHQLMLVQAEHLVHDEIAADVCTLLQLREIPEIFTAEEKAEALDALRVKPFGGGAGKAGGTAAENNDGLIPLSSLSGMNFLAAECRLRLRLCICCSPSDSKTPVLLRRFPALTSCCTVNFFWGWSTEALYCVAQQKLRLLSPALQHQRKRLLRLALTQPKKGEQGKPTSINNVLDEKQQIKVEKLCEACADIFEATGQITENYREEHRRFFYVTPASYLRLLDGFCHLFIQQVAQQQQQQLQYQLGLQKLEEVSSQVREMQQQLETLQPELIKASEKTQQLMEALTLKREHAATTMGLVEAEERVCKSQTDAAALVERECQGQLAEVMPALLAAEEALKKLSKADITELKSMKSPPSGVVKVMEALCKLFGVQPVLVQVVPGQPPQADYWVTGKKHLLGNSRFLQKLLEFDRDAIAPNVMKAIAPYDEEPDFNPDVIKKASLAATSLCLWIKALIAYDKAAFVVKPRRVALQQAQCELQAAEALLRDKKQELLQLENLIDQLSSEHQEAVQRLESLQKEVQTCERRLSVAEKLIASLGGESTRWQHSLDTLKKKGECITGDVVLSAACVEFGGVFRPSYRARCLTTWRGALEKQGLKMTFNYSLQDALSSPEEVQQWVMQGLPNDQLSIENAAITIKAQCCPMLIDPHQQAAQWLAHTFPDMKVLRAEDPHLLGSLQLMLQSGAVVVLECFSERLDPSFNPLLESKRPRQVPLAFLEACNEDGSGGDSSSLFYAGSSTVTLGNNLVDVHPNFRLLLKTPLNAPHFPPEVCSRLTLIDFSVGCKGLEQRLLRLALQAAAPDIHAMCLRLVREEAENRAQLISTEHRMLEALSEAKESVLDDLELLSTLRHAKAVSDSCEERLQEQQKAQVAAEATLSLYSPVAQRAAGLFQVLEQLEGVHPMYLFSVQNLQQCFVEAVLEVAGRPDASQRQQDVCRYNSDLVEATLQRVYRSVYPCLFEGHKSLLIVLLALQSLEIRGAATSAEIQQLLSPVVPPGARAQRPGSPRSESSATSEAVEQSWLTDGCRERLQGLVCLGQPFTSLVASVLEGNGEWEGALYEDNPLAAEWPQLWNQRLSLLQQTLLVQCVRPECLRTCLQQLAQAELGCFLGEALPLGLAEALELAGPKAPLLILLAPGADPQAALLQQAEAAHMRNKFAAVALGKGQGPKASSAICSGVESGQWVLLQNCHLGVGFLEQLSVFVSDLTMQNPHKDFRLILTTVPCKNFPSAILLRSVKLAYDAPQGLRQNLLHSYGEASLTWLDTHPRATLLRPVVFRLCFLHALLLGRRRFGPLGWVSPVDFSTTDLAISLQQLQAAVPPDFVQPLPWSLLQHFASDVNYGGRVTDEWDRRLLHHLCCECLTDECLTPDAPISPSGAFTVPSPTLTCVETFAHIRSLTFEEQPQLFGLQANAALAVAAAESTVMQQLLMDVQQHQGASLNSGSNKATASSSGEMMERASTLLAQLPPLFNMELAAASKPHAYKNAMDAALLQEVARYNALIALTIETFQVLKDAAEGVIEYTAQVEELHQCLRQNRVPQAVAAASYPMAFGLAAWLANLKIRVDFIELWLREGPPHPFWLPGCFSVRSVCTAMLQQFARHEGLKIDSVSFSFSVLSHGESETISNASRDDQQDDEEYVPPFAHDVSGLFLHGASWSPDDMALIEQDYWAVFSPLPLLRLQPTHVNLLSRPERAYDCPLYCTSKRGGTQTISGLPSNFILSVPLPMLEGDSEATWAKRGAALVAQVVE